MIRSTCRKIDLEGNVQLERLQKLRVDTDCSLVDYNGFFLTAAQNVVR